MNRPTRWKKHPFLIRLLHWEYWSFGMVYTWIYPVWLYLSIRARSFFFFSAANPSIKNGGFLAESKKDVYSLMPAHLYPPSLFFNGNSDGNEVLGTLKNAQFHYPVVGKPDIGGRGRAVKVLRSDDDVIEYAKMSKVNFHIQQFISLPNEVGVFYYRIPGEPRGHVSGIVRKEFLSVNGDGTSTMRQLLENNDRSLLQMKTLEKTYGKKLDIILNVGEQIVLVPYGNHARGAKFIDDTHLVDEQLEKVIDDICSQIQGFYFGRLDIRFNTMEELKQAKNFCVIEVNGAGSEPTHIYDPKHSLFFAWKEIVRHWHIMWKISTLNHARGHKYLSVKEGVAMFREDRENTACIERIS